MNIFCMLQRRKNNLKFSIRILYENTQRKQNTHQLPDKCNKILHIHTRVHTQHTVEQLKVHIHSLTHTHTLSQTQTTACTLCRFKAERISHLSMCVCVYVSASMCSFVAYR